MVFACAGHEKGGDDGLKFKKCVICSIKIALNLLKK
jgi:hypothetical protein